MVWAIAIHGGAGVDPALPMERQLQVRDALLRCLNLGISALKGSVPALDVVELVVRELENEMIFNSGRGSALSNKGTVEMDASIMDGFTNKCGAVSGVSTVKNPISLARLVMERSPHVYLAFYGAEDFAREHGVEIMDNEYFITDENKDRLEQAKKQNSIQFDCRLATGVFETPKNTPYMLPTVRIPEPFHKNQGKKIPCKCPSDEVEMNGMPIDIYKGETVGCAAVDMEGHCASATSTGGLINKRCGRIGDSPLIGCGTYADSMCAVSVTGEGEAIIRATVARDVAALMEYKGLNLKESVDYVIDKRLEQGKGGLIAISSDGEFAAKFNTVGMFRACASESGHFELGIWN